MWTILFHHAFVLCEFSCNIVNPGPHMFELMHLYLLSIQIFSARNNEEIGSWSTQLCSASSSEERRGYKHLVLGVRAMATERSRIGPANLA